MRRVRSLRLRVPVRVSAARRHLVEAARGRLEGSAAQDFLGRLGVLDFANSIVLFGASLLLSVLPFVILLSSLANHRIDTDLSRHIGLDSQGARILNQLFRYSPHHSAASIVIALILAAVGTMAVAGSLQVIDERVLGQQHRGWRDILRFAAWVCVLPGILAAGNIVSQPVRAAGGPVAQGLVSYAGTAAFFWWTMHYFSAAIISDSRLYGTIGVVFTLLTWFIALGAVIVLGAAAGATWDQRKDRSGRVETAGPAVGSRRA